MGLDFRLTGIKDYKTVCLDGEGFVLPRTTSVIFLTMFTQVGWGLDERNIDEFISRATMFESVVGPVTVGPQGPVPLTREEMLAHLGLWTNVAGEPRSAFLDDLFRRAAPSAGNDPYALQRDHNRYVRFDDEEPEAWRVSR
ncbi:hypothetical protein OG474_30610 [Kribbella sp. NBC_01505]|uniref:hypothetical protein n=1 Tax=Kribbella sp. NBC_01505 TaxID=2903580 RepID=UPI00386EBCCB